MVAAPPMTMAARNWMDSRTTEPSRPRSTRPLPTIIDSDPASPAIGGADAEDRHLVDGQVDADDLGRGLVVADGDDGPAGAALTRLRTSRNTGTAKTSST